MCQRAGGYVGKTEQAAPSEPQLLSLVSTCYLAIYYGCHCYAANRPEPNGLDKNDLLFSLTVSVGSEFRKGSAEWFCLGVVHAVVVRWWLEPEHQESGAAGA